MSECVPVIDPTITVSVYYGPEPEDVLVIPPECPESDGFWWNALELPNWTTRYSYAPPSIWVPGSVLLGAVADSAAIPIRIAVRSTTAAGLEVQKGILASRLFVYGLVIGIDADYGIESPDVTNLGLWRASPVVPAWGPVTPQRAGTLVVETSLSIPVQPAGAP